MKLNCVTVSETPSGFKQPKDMAKGQLTIASGYQDCQGNCGLQHCKT